MFKNTRISLKLKVSLYLTTGILIIGVGILLIVQYLVYDSLKNELIARGQAIGESFAKTSAPLIVTRNKVLLNQQVVDAVGFESVDYVIIENDSNTILSDSFNGNVPSELAILKRSLSDDVLNFRPDTLLNYTNFLGAENEIYEVLSPVEQGILGYIRIGLKKEYIDEEIQKTIIFILLTILFSIILSLIGALLLVNSITTPIIYLTESADKISMGDFATPIHVKENNEIGDLGNAIERMRESLKAAIDRLRKRQSMRV